MKMPFRYEPKTTTKLLTGRPAEQNRMETLACTCKQCRGVFHAEVNLGAMERLGLTDNFLPSLCDACAAEEEVAHSKDGLHQNLAAAIPFDAGSWDKKRGNATTMRLVRGAIQSHGSVYIQGDTGKGKTRSLCFMAHSKLALGQTVGWYDASNLMDRISHEAMAEDNGLETLKARVLHHSILVLDDLGKGKPTEHRAAAIFDILDRCIKAGRQQVWVTSNKTPDQLAVYFGDYGRPIVQRLGDMCKQVTL